MLEQAINKILSMAAPNYFRPHEHESAPGQQALVYTDKSVKLIAGPEYPTIKATTLMALKQFIDFDFREGDDRRVHVAGPDLVRYLGGVRPDGLRNVFCEIRLDLGRELLLDRFIDLESFIIHLQTAFVPTDSTTKLLEFLSSIVVGENGQFEDKGIFQNITVKSGITTVVSQPVTPRVELVPFRTFTEVEQPVSTFLFRMKATNEARNITCALFNCDGNAWRPVAMARIADWITFNVEHKIPILA